MLIDTPPHSTGLAFDIDYRYMSGEEQNFLMAELARLNDEGRIEVIRERAANYHVFAFIDGQRPGDELITASLEEAGAPVQEAHHATKQPPASFCHFPVACMMSELSMCQPRLSGKELPRPGDGCAPTFPSPDRERKAGKL